jgi:hypothetical protein
VTVLDADSDPAADSVAEPGTEDVPAEIDPVASISTVPKAPAGAVGTPARRLRDPRPREFMQD